MSKADVAHSEFGTWFDAQFPVDPTFSELSDDALNDQVEDGRAAEQELLRRRIRREQERAALYAWQAYPITQRLRSVAGDATGEGE